MDPLQDGNNKWGLSDYKNTERNDTIVGTVPIKGTL